MKRNKIEEALESILNDDIEKSKELIKSFCVETTNKIYESLMAADDSEEVTDEIKSDKAEIEAEEILGEAEDEDIDIDSETEEKVDVDVDSDDESIDDRLDTIIDRLDHFQSMYDKLVGIDTVDVVDVEVDSEIVGIDDEVEVDIDGGVLSDDMSELEEDDILAQLDESFATYAKVVKVDTKEGDLLGSGKVAVEKHSPVASEAEKITIEGEGLEVTGKVHDGYSRETAEKPKLYKSDVKAGEVPKDGSSKALLNSDAGRGKPDTKSVLTK